MTKYKLDPTKYGFVIIENLSHEFLNYIDIFSEKRFVKILPKSKVRYDWLLLEMGLCGLQEETRITIKRGVWDCGKFITPKLVYYGNIDNDDFFQHLITQL